LDNQPPAARPGDLLASKYRVERVLGQGGMGVVVSARHEQLGFRVAVKFMLPMAVQDAGMRDRFLREARAAGRLRGEHVARVMDFGTLDDGAPYIVMEFLEGSDLQDVLAARGPLPVPEAVDYLLQACKAMEEAHEQGIVHRDLKPQNLFLTRRPDGTPLVKVLDFGISKLVEPEAQSMSMTSSTAIMGSPLYMAPEQLRSSKNVDARADVYSLGVILYQLTSGALPIEASTLAELFEHVFMRTVQPLRERVPTISPEFDAVVMRCLAKEPSARFQSVPELASALASVPRGSVHGVQPIPAGQTAAADASWGPGGPPAVPAAMGPITTLGNAAASASFATAPRRSSMGVALAVGGIAVVAIAGATLALRRHSPANDARPEGAATSLASSPPPAPSAVADEAPSANLAAIESASSASTTAPSATAAAPAAANAAPSASPLAPAAPARASMAPATTASSRAAGKGGHAPGTAPSPAPATAKTAAPKSNNADPFASPD
jgi:Protein kinase domain